MFCPECGSQIRSPLGCAFRCDELPVGEPCDPQLRGEGEIQGNTDQSAGSPSLKLVED